MSRSLIIYFSRADENYAVGYIDKGNTEIVAEFVQELTGADMFKVEPACRSLCKRLQHMHPGSKAAYW